METAAVIGSINMDLVVRVDRFPNPGETLPGHGFATVPGGKGANQAVALARLGVDVRMAGVVGQDAFGDQYIAHLQNEKVDTSMVTRGKNPTGVAMIEVEAGGENRIVVARGANGEASIEWIKSILPRAETSKVILMQLEIPVESVLAAARAAAWHDGMVILDPAPMQDMPEELLTLCHIITPNAHELRALTAAMPEAATTVDRMRNLVQRGATNVLHKRGIEGAYLCTKNGIEHFSAYRVDTVDTTAAGDSFNAGLALGILHGLSMSDCVRVACAVGALSTTKLGAQAGMPSLNEVRMLMKKDFPL